MGRPRKTATPAPCQADVQPRCTRPVFAGGLCAAHYSRMRRGQPMDVPVRPIRGTPHRTTVALSDDAWVALERQAEARKISPAQAAREILTAALLDRDP